MHFVKHYLIFQRTYPFFLQSLLQSGKDIADGTPIDAARAAILDAMYQRHSQQPKTQARIDVTAASGGQNRPPKSSSGRKPPMVVSVVATFCSMFQHSNLATPHWLGYLVTRPESHSLHHERDVHAWNYGDIPLWDMVFGTFRNPRQWDGQAGFHDGSTRQWSMLLGRKIS